MRKYWHCATSLLRIRATFNKCSIRWRLRVDHNFHSVYIIEAAESKFEYCLILVDEYLSYRGFFYFITNFHIVSKFYLVQKRAFSHEKYNLWKIDEFFGESKCLTFSLSFYTSEWLQMPEKTILKFAIAQKLVLRQNSDTARISMIKCRIHKTV